MTLTNLLTENDRKCVSDYVLDATGVTPVSVDDIMSSWSAAKQCVASSMFTDDDDATSLRKTFHISQPVASEEMRDEVRDRTIPFIANVADYLWAFADSGCAYSDVVKSFVALCDPDDIISGHIQEDDAFLYDDECVFVRAGEKPMHAIRKVLEWYGYMQMYEFTRWRDDISAITTCKKRSVDVTLSIHPLDFMSMSDNACGWTSCMSWITKNGSCSSGVIEMLNSPTAIIAYIESADGSFFDGMVPNKSWRMLVFCDAQTGLVLGGRQYPYESSTLGRAVVEECAKLLRCTNSANVVRWPFMEYEKAIVKNCDNSDVKETTDAVWSCVRDYGNNGVIPYSFGMCNDFLMFPDSKFFVSYGDDVQTRVCMSGPATCMRCGNPLDTDTYHIGEKVGWDSKLCRECDEEARK